MFTTRFYRFYRFLHNILLIRPKIVKHPAFHRQITKTSQLYITSDNFPNHIFAPDFAIIFKYQPILLISHAGIETEHIQVYFSLVHLP